MSVLQTFFDKILGRTERRAILNKQSARQAELVRMEEEVGKVLPSDYRAFLQTSKGEELFFNTFDVRSQHNPDKVLYNFEIKHFLYLNPSGLHDIYTNWLRFRDRLPSFMVPIAFDKFRNLMCLHLQSGNVFLWDIQSLVEKDKNETALQNSLLSKPNFYYVASSFTKFTENLYRQQRFQ